MGRYPPQFFDVHAAIVSPIAEAPGAWVDETAAKLLRKPEPAAAFRYMRARWTVEAGPGSSCGRPEDRRHRRYAV